MNLVLKKIFFAAVLFHLACFSSNAFADSKSEGHVLHTKGLSAYVDKEYGKAFDFFKQSYELEPTNDGNGYYLGLASLQLNDFPSAEKYLNELLTRNPDYQEAYFDYALSLYRQNKFDKALPYLKKVEKEFAGSEAAMVATEWIAKIEGGEKPTPLQEKEEKRWSLKGLVGGFYDSNVIRDPENEDLAGFPFQNAFLTVGSIDFKYLLARGEKSKFFGGYSGYQNASVNHDISNFNYGRHKAVFDFIYSINDSFQWRIPSHYSFVTLGKAKYVQTAGAESAIDMFWMKNLMTTLTLGGEWDRFFGTVTNANQDRTGSRAIGKIEQYFFASGNREFYIKGGFGFEKNMASGNDWDYQSYNIYASLQTPLPWKFKLLLLNDIAARRNFLHTDSVFNAQRKDQGTISTAVLSRELSPLFTLLASYSYALTDSNIVRFSYHRQVGGLTLQVKL